MTRIWKGKRILSLALALILLMTSVNLPAPIFAANEEQTASDTTEQTNPMVGCKVKLAEANGLVYAYPDPSNASQYTLTGSYAFPKVMVIKSVYESSSKTYYQIFAAEGYSWPENSNITEGYYLESTKVTVLEPCDKCGKLDCDSSHENWCDICKVDNCTNDHISATVTDIQGNPVVGSDGEPLKVTVAGDLPDGATVVASVPEINGEQLPNVFDIKVLKPDGTEWQPIDEGKTVTLSIPVNTDAEYVDVVHFIDYARAIDAGTHYLFANDLSASDRVLLERYLSASGRPDHIAYDFYARNPVVGRTVNLITDSFSVYVLSEHEDGFVEGTSGTDVPFDNEIGDGYNEEAVRYKYYATAQTDFRFSTTGVVIYDPMYESYFTVRSGSEYVTLTNESGNGSGGKKVDIYIDENTPAGTSIKVLFATRGSKLISGLGKKACLVEIIIVRPVDIIFDDNLDGTGITASNIPANKTGDDKFITDGNLAKYTIPSTAPTASKETCRFKEWNTMPDGTGNPYKPGDVIQPTRDITLYAIWDNDNYYVDYDLNGGSGNVSKDPVMYAKGTAITLPAAPTKANVVFLGWSVTDDGYGALLPAGSTYTVNSNVTFHAIWGVNLTVNVSNGTLTLQKDGETSGTALENHTYADGTSIFSKSTNGAVTTYTATLVEGYLKNAFFVYQTNNNTLKASVGSNNSNINATKLSEEKAQAATGTAGITQHTELTFSAASKETYYISFDTNGGTTISPIPVYENDSFNTLPAEPEKLGYNFAGWIDKEKNAYQPIDKVTQNVTFYAVWEPIIYKIYLVGSGAQEDYDSVGYDYNIGNTELQLPTPTRTGYKFTGWKVTTADGSWEADKVYSGSFANMYGNVTLTAQWEASTTMLTIDVKYPDGADYSIDGEQGFLFDISADGKVILTVAVLKDGYVTIDGLTIGKTYTVTLKNSWSWRYGDEVSKTVTIAAGGSTVEFEVKRDKDKWLDGNDYWPNSSNQNQN